MNAQELYDYFLKKAMEAAAKAVKVEVESADVEEHCRYTGLTYAYAHAAGLVKAHLIDGPERARRLEAEKEKATEPKP